MSVRKLLTDHLPLQTLLWFPTLCLGSRSPHLRARPPHQPRTPRPHPFFQAQYATPMAALCPLSLLCPHRVHSVLLRNYPGPSLSTDSPVSSTKVTAWVPAQGTGRVSSPRKGRKALLSSAVTVWRFQSQAVSDPLFKEGGLTPARLSLNSALPTWPFPRCLASQLRPWLCARSWRPREVLRVGWGEAGGSQGLSLPPWGRGARERGPLHSPAPLFARNLRPRCESL